MHWLHIVSIYIVICVLNIGLGQGSHDSEIKELYNRINTLKSRLLERLLRAPKSVKDGDCPSPKCKAVVGIEGIPGTKGEDGHAGMSGAPGLPGDRGRPCINKPAGFLAPLKGYPGIDGPKGRKGHKGSKGKCTCEDRVSSECTKCPNKGNGSRGPIGRQGLPGSPGVNGIMGPKGDTLFVDRDSSLPGPKCMPDP